MATQFCTNCREPLAAGALFCAACGSPTRGTTPETAQAPSTPDPDGGTPSAASSDATGSNCGPTTSPGALSGVPSVEPPLGSVLGLQGVRNFLLQHELLSGGRNYRVLNHEKRHLFTVREDVRQELVEGFLGEPAGPAHGFHLGRAAHQVPSIAWTVADAAGNPRGTIQIQASGNAAVSTLANGSGTPILSVNVERSMVGGVSATAAFPDGRAMFAARGNLMRHDFSIHDPSGAEVAKIHEAWASMRDTYNLDVVGSVDPLCPLIFAILIDREKAAG